MGGALSRRDSSRCRRADEFADALALRMNGRRLAEPDLGRLS